MRTPEMLPVTLARHRSCTWRASVTDIAESVTEGRLADLLPGTDRVIVGEIIAQQLGLAIGDPITLLIPTVAANGTPAPRLREFTVAGVFEAALQDHDGTLIFTHLDDVRALAEGSAGEGLRIRFDDVLAASATVAGRWRESCRRASQSSTGRVITPAISAPSASRRR